jgi:hypothetical protein
MLQNIFRILLKLSEKLSLSEIIKKSKIKMLIILMIIKINLLRKKVQLIFKKELNKFKLNNLNINNKLIQNYKKLVKALIKYKTKDKKKIKI